MEPQMEQNEIPIIYLWIYKKFCDKWGRCNTIVYTTELKAIMRRTIYQIPNKYDYAVLKEMINYKLLEKINRHKCKLLGFNAGKKLKKIDNYSIF